MKHKFTFTDEKEDVEITMEEDEFQALVSILRLISRQTNPEKRKEILKAIHIVLEKETENATLD